MSRICLGKAYPGQAIATLVTERETCLPGETDMGPIGLPPQAPNANTAPVSGNPITDARTLAGNTASNVANAAWPQPLQNFFKWFSSAEHWKGIGLIVAAGVLGVVGLIIWTGHGGDTVRVATQTGERMALA